MSSRRKLPLKHIRQGISALHACLAHEDKTQDIFMGIHKGKIHDRAGIEYHYHLIVQSAERIQELFLLFRKVVVSGNIPSVGCFSGCTADTVDRGITVLFFGLLSVGSGKRPCSIGIEKAFHASLGFHDLLQEIISPLYPLFVIFTVIIREPLFV